MKPSKYKYIVYSGYVISPRDGDTHYITASQVMALYRVSPQDCIIIKERNRPMELTGLDASEMLLLFPRSDGDYRLDLCPKGVNDRRVGPSPTRNNHPLTLDQIIRRAILKSLERWEDSQVKAAEELEISPQTIRNWLRSKRGEAPSGQASGDDLP